MKRFVCSLAALTLLLPFTLYAQVGSTGAIPEVDVAEAIRRGPMVTSSGMGVRSADETAIIKANAPPADDNNRWHITMFSSDSCPPCVKLKADFQKSPELLAFVAAPEGSIPWAHFNCYNCDDATQQWRIKPYKITVTPTIVVQPPRDWSWGDPGTVICKIQGYDGNAKTLAGKITANVREYARVMGPKGYPKAPRPVSIETKEEHSTPLSLDVPTVGAGQYTPVGDSRTAPFAVPSPVDPFRPQTYPAPSPGGDFGPPMAPAVLTVDQITQAIPDATPEFILAQYQAKATDINAVKLAWLVEKAKKPAEPAKVPEPTPLTFEQVKELMPLEDSAVVLEVVNAKPTSKEQALAVASDVKKKMAEQPSETLPGGITDVLGSLVSSAMSYLLGPKMAVFLLVILVAIQVLKIIAPQTKTKLDDDALVILQKVSSGLPKSPANGPSSTP
jgi:thiol-disulfide isomerase/thioredoxin